MDIPRSGVNGPAPPLHGRICSPRSGKSVTLVPLQPDGVGSYKFRGANMPVLLPRDLAKPSITFVEA
jgi:hypothetical protein